MPRSNLVPSWLSGDSLPRLVVVVVAVTSLSKMRTFHFHGSFWFCCGTCVQANTHSIQTLTGQISRLVGMMESESDFLHCRKLVDDAVQQATETRTLLMRIQDHQHSAQNAAEKTNRRMMYHKLSDNLAITARVLEDVVRRFNTEEKKRQSTDLFVPPGDAAGGNEAPIVSTSGLSDPKKPDEDMKSLQRIYTDLTHSNDQQSAFE
eukprot:3255941-Amphidinium_carterae.1